MSLDNKATSSINPVSRALSDGAAAGRAPRTGQGSLRRSLDLNRII